MDYHWKTRENTGGIPVQFHSLIFTRAVAFDIYMPLSVSWIVHLSSGIGEGVLQLKTFCQLDFLSARLSVQLRLQRLSTFV